MNKFLLFLLVFVVCSCDKESKKKVPTLVPIANPAIIVEGKPVAIDSLLLKSFESKLLTAFYLNSGYKSVWQSKKNRRNIISQLSKSDEDGLNPTHYDLNKLQKFEKKYVTLKEHERAIYDILLTHSFQKYISHLSNGQIKPKNLYKDWDLKLNAIDINKTIANILKTDSLNHKIEDLKPKHLVYQNLKKALKIINSFPKDNFTAIEIDNKIVLNDTNPALISIKKRLIYWKDMNPKDSLSSIYDLETKRAMKNFQIRHGLAADGVIGKGTVAALNFSKKKRKEQILANLERWKWFPKEMGKEYVIVNIPDYKLVLVENTDTIRTHKVIVGRDKRPTPILSSKLTHVVFNPTWTVPPTILREDVIPSITRNRRYLAQTNIKIFDSKGNEVSAGNWKLSRAKGYRYVQSPGTFNSLGMVKFVFPNRFSIYLHDTNHRDFFGKQKRSLSSGCVRVENPLELVETLLGEGSNWDLEKITKILQSEKTKHIKLQNKIDIHILYWTAWSENNQLIFRDDIYNLDGDLYQKLRN
jgi:murein L,D-transpeptidase YcbB/YkuD